MLVGNSGSQFVKILFISFLTQDVSVFQTVTRCAVMLFQRVKELSPKTKCCYEV